MAGAAAIVTALAIVSAGCSGGSGTAPSASSAAASAAPPPSVSRPSTAATAAALVPRVRPTGAAARRTVVAGLLARSTPVRVRIAAIGVDSTLMALGLKADGTMEVPPGGFPAGWYTGAPTPGELGPAVIAGHVDMLGPGVFYNLHRLRPGAEITVTRKDGSRPVFRVTRLEQFAKDKFPTSRVYGDIDHAGLRLITCGGSFNRQSGHYDDNVVVFADLVAPVQ